MAETMDLFSFETPVTEPEKAQAALAWTLSHIAPDKESRAALAREVISVLEHPHEPGLLIEDKENSTTLTVDPENATTSIYREGTFARPTLDFLSMLAETVGEEG